MPYIHNTRPTVVPAPSSPIKKERMVGFHVDPVESFSRPVNTTESWPAYHYEMHARKCAFCHNAYEVHRDHRQLCEVGHRLAQEVTRHIYNKPDGNTYSTAEEDKKLVRVEIPAGYVEVGSLLKAIERSLRHRSRRPFVSMDRSYFVAARSSTSTLQRTRPVKVEQEPKKIKSSRPRSGEIVDWPESQQPQPKPKRVLSEISNTVNSKRGSLYEEDLAKQRRNAKHYAVEVREPAPRERRSSAYHR
jgi:hypothetical protein